MLSWSRYSFIWCKLLYWFAVISVFIWLRWLYVRCIICPEKCPEIVKIFCPKNFNCARPENIVDDGTVQSHLGKLPERLWTVPLSAIFCRSGSIKFPCVPIFEIYLLGRHMRVIKMSSVPKMTDLKFRTASWNLVDPYWKNVLQLP